MSHQSEIAQCDLLNPVKKNEIPNSQLNATQDTPEEMQYSWMEQYSMTRKKESQEVTNLTRRSTNELSNGFVDFESSNVENNHTSSLYNFGLEY